MLISACQQVARQPADDELRNELERQLSSAEFENMQLRVQLIQQQQRLDQLNVLQEHAIQEVVRAKARLRSHSGKAETVASMAEVKMLIDSAESAAISGESIQRAQQYLAMSEMELDAENYAGAAYLTGQARDLLQNNGSRLAVMSAPADAREKRFSRPIQLQVKSRSNMRKTADINSRVLHKLDAGERVHALAYKAAWIKVRAADGLTGWVYYTLLGVAQ
jgi:hypothetical protein